MTAADRIYEVLDTAPSIVDRPDAVTVRRDAVRAGCASRGSPSATRARRRRCCAASTSTCGRARRWRSSARPAAARPRWSPWCPGCYDVTGGRITLDGHDMRDFTARLAAPAGRRGVRGADAVLHVGPGEPHPGPARTPTDDEVARGAGARPGRLRLRPAVGAGHPGRRAGAVALRRAAAAAGAGPGGARPPALLVLDDPLSALDVHTEALVEEALRAGAARHHRAAGGAPAVDGGAGRPGGAAAGRRDHRGRPALRAAGHRAGLPRRAARPPPDRCRAGDARGAVRRWRTSASSRTARGRARGRRSGDPATVQRPASR